MAIIWMNLAVVYIVSLFSRFLAKPVNLDPNQVWIKPNKFMTMLVIITFVVVAGLRRNIGDTFFYMYTYTLNDFTWEYILSDKDVGFGFLQMILKKISNDPQLLVFVTALITNALIVMVLYKYSRLFELSIYVYITSGLYIVSMNGIRQFLAAAIVFAATKYIVEGNFKKYLLVITVASTIHMSAFILIPIYFIVRRKAWTAATFSLLALAILIVIGYNQLSGILFAALEDTQYSAYKDASEGGANMIRVIVNAVPLLLAFLGRHKLREIFPNSDYIVNMSILSAVFMVIASQNWIFARFNIYFGLYNLILISWVVKLFADKYQKLIYYGMIVCYFLYFYYENAVVLGIVYKSNYFQF